MPYNRPTLSQLRQQAAADVVSGLPGADGLLRFSNLQVLSTVVAGMANLQYGYLDWIAMQSIPFTCTDEFLEAWASLKSVIRLDATKSIGFAAFPATSGGTLPAGTPVVRSDGFSYVTTANSFPSAGVVTAPLIAVSPSSEGNIQEGARLTIGTPVSGISSSGVASAPFTGGSDVETNESLRARMLAAFQNPPQGGAEADYEVWAREVPGVSRAWILRNGQGAGTVVIYFMMDVTQSQYSGFPQGANGVSSSENRDFVATGDQLALANYIYPLQPVTALVYAVSPYPVAINFIISSLLPNTTEMQTKVQDAISDVFLRKGSPGGTGPTKGEVYMANIDAAVNAIPGIINFVITTPNDDVIPPTGGLPVLGSITWTP